MNTAVHRLNTFLEPRVIRHAWTPQLGGGLGFDTVTFTSANGWDQTYNRTGIVSQDTSAVVAPMINGGFFSWIYDIASDPTTSSNQSLLTPLVRHNPLLYARFDTTNGLMHWPQSVAPFGAGSVVQSMPRTGLQNGSIPALVPPSTSNWVGGAWTLGYDELFHAYYRPHSMVNACTLYQDTEDVVGYKQFPFLPRVCKNFDEAMNVTTGEGGLAGDNDAKIYQRLKRFECRLGDRIRVKNNYHNFRIEIFPDLPIEVPVNHIQGHMPGLPATTMGAPYANGIFANGGTLGAAMYSTSAENSTATSQLASAVVPNPNPVTNIVTKGTLNFPGYIKKSPKWFCKVRFIVAKRQVKSTLNLTPDALHLVGIRSKTSASNDFLFDIAPHIRKYATSVKSSATAMMAKGDFVGQLDTVPPTQGPAIVYSALTDPRNIAKDMFNLKRVKYDYKSTLDAGTEFAFQNVEDKTLKIIYDKTETFSGKRTVGNHIMNTMKGKVLEYLKEAPIFGQPQELTAPPGQQVVNVVPTVRDQELLQQPYATEYRMWVVTHCHNCRVEVKAKHVFTFDA